MARKTIIGVVCAVTLWMAAPAQADSNGHTPARRQEVVTKMGAIPGLGAVSASVRVDSRQELTLHGQGFELSRRHDPLTRETIIEIRGEGEAAVTMALGGPAGFSLARGVRRVRGTADVDSIRALLGGRAVAAARERLGAFERRLMAGTLARVDDPHAYGFLLVGALLSSLHGDAAAIGRARDLMTRRAAAGLRSVRFEFKDCVKDYEKYLLQLDQDRTNCLEAANSRDSWYARAADRLGCELEFIAGALAGEGQFVSCTALGAIVQ